MNLNVKYVTRKENVKTVLISVNIVNIICMKNAVNKLQIITIKEEVSFSVFADQKQNIFFFLYYYTQFIIFSFKNKGLLPKQCNLKNHYRMFLGRMYSNNKILNGKNMDLKKKQKRKKNLVLNEY